MGWMALHNFYVTVGNPLKGALNNVCIKMDGRMHFKFSVVEDACYDGVCSVTAMQFVRVLLYLEDGPHLQVWFLDQKRWFGCLTQ
jgi:hypothetical protein